MRIHKLYWTTSCWEGKGDICTSNKLLDELGILQKGKKESLISEASAQRKSIWKLTNSPSALWIRAALGKLPVVIPAKPRPLLHARINQNFLYQEPH